MNFMNKRKVFCGPKCKTVHLNLQNVIANIKIENLGITDLDDSVVVTEAGILNPEKTLAYGEMPVDLNKGVVVVVQGLEDNVVFNEVNVTVNASMIKYLDIRCEKCKVDVTSRTQKLDTLNVVLVECEGAQKNAFGDFFGTYLNGSTPAQNITIVRSGNTPNKVNNSWLASECQKLETITEI